MSVGVYGHLPSYRIALEIVEDPFDRSLGYGNVRRNECHFFQLRISLKLSNVEYQTKNQDRRDRVLNYLASQISAPRRSYVTSSLPEAC